MNLTEVIRAGFLVWTSWDAILHEGVAVADPRLVKQAQVLASAIMVLVGTVGLSVPAPWVNTASLAVLALYAIWSGAATLASTNKIGLTTVISPAGSSSPTITQQVKWPSNLGNPWSRS